MLDIDRHVSYYSFNVMPLYLALHSIPKYNTTINTSYVSYMDNLHRIQRVIFWGIFATSYVVSSSEGNQALGEGNQGNQALRKVTALNRAKMRYSMHI